MMHASEELYNFDRCNSCKLVMLNPRVSQEDLHQFYDESYLPYRGPDAWGKYAGMVEKSLAALDNRRAQKVFDYGRPEMLTRVWDIGCGRPSFLAALNNRFDCDCRGFDFSDEGWQNEKESYSDIKLQQGRLEDWDLDEPADIITMWHYLEHDYDPAHTLRYLKSKVAKGCLLFIEVPDHDSHSRKKYGKNWAGYHTPRHSFLFNPDNLKLLLNANGWNVLEVDRKATLDAYNLYWMSEMEKRGIDWTASMEDKFRDYLKGMIGHRLSRLFSPGRPDGIMCFVAVAN